MLDGTCNGQPAQLLDPKGGNTAFLVGGSVGAGMHFRATNAATGEVLEETVNGRGIAEDRLFYCTFLFEDVATPTGTIDVLFEVWGLPTPQGPLKPAVLHPSIVLAVVTAAAGQRGGRYWPHARGGGARTESDGSASGR